MAKKSPKSKSTTTPIGPGRGYVAPEAGKTHSGGSGSTQQFAESVGRTDTGAVAKAPTPSSEGTVIDTPSGKMSVAKDLASPFINQQVANQFAGAFIPKTQTTQPTFAQQIGWPPTGQEVLKSAALGVGIAGAGIGLGTAGLAAISAFGGAGAVSKAAAGQIIKADATGLIRGIPAAAVNTKTAALTTSLIGKLGLSVGAVTLAVGAIGSYPFAKFEMAEASDKLGIAMFRASQAGDTAKVQELAALQKELFNPSTIDKILSWIPYANVYNAAKKNAEAALLSAKAFDYLAEQEKLKQENGETDAQMWERIYAEQDARKEQQRLADEEYFNIIAENQKRAKEETRSEDAAYWAQINADAAARKEAERKADAEYWEAVKKSWQKAKDENTKSKLKFGLL